MPNRFKIRRGSNAPTTSDLEEYELGIVASSPDGSHTRGHPLIYTKMNGSMVPIAAGNSNELGAVAYSHYARTDGTPGDNGWVPSGKYPTSELDGHVHPLGGGSGSARFAGDIYVGGTADLTAVRALYADIAEYYETKETQEPGQVMMIGTDFEGELSDGSRPLMGVCSTEPAFVMNDAITQRVAEEGEILHYAPIALKGRVPIKITGEAKRGQYIIVDSENPGFAKAVNKLPAKLDRDCNLIGICITSSEKKSGICEVKV